MIALALRYWYAGVIAALVALLGVQQVRIAHAQAQVATLKQTAAELVADREKVALAHATHIASLQLDHAAQQQQQEIGYARKINDLETRRRAAAGESERLRHAIFQYAASGSLRGGEVDTPTAERAADRLDKLSSLLAEGTNLLEEGRGVVERRDAEVGRLLEQIGLDRRICSK